MPPPFDLLPRMLDGAVITIQLTLISGALAFLLSFVGGLARLSRFAFVRAVAGAYIEAFRGTSLLVQMFWLFFALPLMGIRFSPMSAGILALTLNIGAYGSEIVRSSILAIPKEQTEAGIALNMSGLQRLRRVILPQALVIMLPPFGNLVIELLKSTSLVSLITITDLTFAAHTLNNSTFRSTEIYVLLLLMYFCLAYPLTLGVRWLERRLTAGRLAP